ncbi:MAG TPA: hypothetical protein VFF45_00750, partial [Bacilli bacterium]|nr:hypothetical protein [Bacilli bacterium]
LVIGEGGSDGMAARLDVDEVAEVRRADRTSIDEEPGLGGVHADREGGHLLLGLPPGGLEAELLLGGQRVGTLDGDLKVLGSVAVPAEGQFGSAELTGDIGTLLELPGGAVSALGVLPAAGVTRSIAAAEVLGDGVGRRGGVRGGRWGRGWGRTGQGRGANKNAEEGSGEGAAGVRHRYSRRGAAGFGRGTGARGLGEPPPDDPEIVTPPEAGGLERKWSAHAQCFALHEERSGSGLLVEMGAK